MPIDFGSCLHAPQTSHGALQAEVRPSAGASARTPVPNGAAVTIGGQPWVAQTGTADAITIDGAGRVTMQTRNGENASFDTPNKIRAEVCGARRYSKGEAIHFRGNFTVAVDARLQGALWTNLVQVHQADSRRADGRFVNASPPFAVAIRQLPGAEPELIVVKATSAIIPPEDILLPTTIVAQAPARFGVEHRFAVTFVDGHGGPGHIRVEIDGKPLIDRDEKTGYSYVDQLASARPGGQSTGSYLKFGIYSGWKLGDLNPPSLQIRCTFGSLSTEG